MNKPHLLIIGSPGSGKGTLSQYLKTQGFSIFSMGSKLRCEVKKQTSLGLQIQINVEKGILIPDAIAMQLFTEEIKDNLHTQFAIEGFPSTVKQYELFLQFLKEHNLLQKMEVLYIDCPESLAIERIVNRRICSNCSLIYNIIYNPPLNAKYCNDCGGILYRRKEDTVECAKSRIETFKKNTLPILRLAKISLKVAKGN